MPRFVLLYHELPPDAEKSSHWDFMLETGDVLRTWSLAEQPEIGKLNLAQRIHDHRMKYLDYEGPISENRGTVKQIDRGDYEIVKETADRFVVELAGVKLQGQLILELQV